MGEILYFKNCDERKKAEEILKKNWPEVSFVVMRIDKNEILQEQRIHFGKWDVNEENMSVFYDNKESKIPKIHWEISVFLVSEPGFGLSIKERAYALLLTETEALLELEGLLNVIEKTGSQIIKTEAGRYKFEELVV